MHFKDKVVLVTGASSGIGRATALAFAQQGAIVVCTARREAELQAVTDLCQQQSPRSDYLVADMGLREEAEGIVDKTLARHGRLDILVNNAGIPKHKLIYRISVDEAEDVMRVNFLSCLWACFKAIPPMLAQGGGVIVNVSSFATHVTPTHESLYAASKGAMDSFTRGLWTDLKGSGIEAILIHPGPIETPIWDKLDEQGAYSGPFYPAELVAKEILEAVVENRRELVVPRRNLQLTLARVLNFFIPSVVRSGVQRMDPINKSSIEAARQRALAGKVMGEE